MKRPRLFLVAFIAFTLSANAYAQDPHVHTRYLKESKTTVVQTDWMYLINNGQQFLQMGLITRYPNERLERPPKKIDVLIWSYSRQALYRNAKGPTLKIGTDEESWSIDPRNYIVFKGETKNGQDIFWDEKRSEMGQPSVLPKEALVRGKEGINDLFMEQIYIELTPEQLAKLARSAKANLHLGANEVAFAKTYLDTIRDFNGRLVPGAQSVTNAKSQVTPTASQSSGAPPDLGVVNGRALSLPRPRYPDLAKSSYAQGSVHVFVTIDETGKVIAARAISGHPLLHEVSEEAAKAALFSPTSVKGHAVKVTGIIIYNFVR